LELQITHQTHADTKDETLANEERAKRRADPREDLPHTDTNRA